jgi:hypothetical protein
MVKELLILRGERYRESFLAQVGPKDKEKLWFKISCAFNEKFSMCLSHRQVNKKWIALVAEYRTYKADDIRTGNEVPLEKPQYWDELNNVLGNRSGLACVALGEAEDPVEVDDFNEDSVSPLQDTSKKIIEIGQQRKRRRSNSTASSKEDSSKEVDPGYAILKIAEALNNSDSASNSEENNVELRKSIEKLNDNLVKQTSVNEKILAFLQSKEQ